MDEDQKNNSEGNVSASYGTSKKLMKYDILKKIIIGLVGIVIIMLIFGIGIIVGEKKAGFSYRWAEEYHRNFAGPREGFFGNWRSFPRGDFIDANGVFGQIIKIDGPTILIKGDDNVEKIIIVKDDTIIQRLRDTLKINDLKIDDFIVVIGQPNDSGQIEAKFIRLLPPPPEASLGPFPPSMFY
jgi:hypothetical protein